MLNTYYMFLGSFYRILPGGPFVNCVRVRLGGGDPTEIVRTLSHCFQAEKFDDLYIIFCIFSYKNEPNSLYQPQNTKHKLYVLIDLKLSIQNERMCSLFLEFLCIT